MVAWNVGVKAAEADWQQRFAAYAKAYPEEAALFRRWTSGELPAVTVLQNAPGNSGEGTAMLEIVHDVAPNAQLYFATAWLGSDGNGSSAAYETLEEAQQYPFRYTFPIVDPIEITRFTIVSNAVLRFETDGNVTRDPIVTFSIRSTTNLLLPLAAWDSLPVQSNSRTNEMNYLSLSNPPGFQRYFAVEPLWP